MDPVIILNKKLKLRTSSGLQLEFLVIAFEYENPYAMHIQMKRERLLQVKVTNEDLATELKDWLQGKHITWPSLLIPPRVEEAMMKFLKFGKPPSQRDLIFWILSRCEVSYGEKCFVSFGGQPESTEEFLAENDSYFMHNFDASSSQEVLVEHNRMEPRERRTDRPSSAPSYGRKSTQFETTGNSSVYEVTRELLGESDALKKLSHAKVKGREGAKVSLVQTAWTDDHFRLTHEIITHRQRIESTIEQRRRALEMAKVRQQQAMEKYSAIRDKLNRTKGDNLWAAEASDEVLTLQKIEADVEADVLKQQCRSQRATQHVRWTMAPNGFANRRGRSQRGPLLGYGPLPAEATTNPKDPRIETASQYYYWDQSGRRHRKRPEDVEQGSVVEQAMEAIRKAAATASLYKLDLRVVFAEMDVSGDGFIDVQEMGAAFRKLGLQLSDESLTAVFRSVCLAPSS